MNVGLRVAPLVLVAAVVQVSAVTGSSIMSVELDVLLVTIVAIALLTGSVPGAIAGFFGGLAVDVMTLDTLGFTSLLLILAGYWAGRYGETTGRGRAYAVSLAAFAITLLVGVAALVLHYLLGDTVSASSALTPLLPSAIAAALLVIPVHRIARSLIGGHSHGLPAGQVELV